jgi:hypothetical protein
VLLLAGAAAALILFLGAVLPLSARADTTPAPCAQTLDPLPSGAGSTTPCWGEVSPYPFGSDGQPVDPSKCQNQDGSLNGACYLIPSSLSFRAWNRGLARTQGSSAFGLWRFNGSRWFPDPTFPGNKQCPGTKVVWAGKLDFWVIAAGTPWAGLCRFDGFNFIWEPLSLPKATVARGKALDATIGNDSGVTGITSGACRAWNDCWFFGTYGTIVHWDGNVLSDESPDVVAKPWLGTEFASAAIDAAPDGTSVGVAVGTSSFGTASKGGPLPAQPDGSAPPQIYTETATGWGPTNLQPPSIPIPADPFRTDLVAADIDASGGGWIAGDPAGWRIGSATPARRTAVTTPEPSPLIPFGTPNCAGPPLDTFTRAPLTPGRSTDSVLWSSVAVLPTTGHGLAGGQINPVGDNIGEPILAQVDCSGGSVMTRFRVPDPESAATPTPLVPADKGGWVAAIAATAPNDAWAAITTGRLAGGTIEPPRLYRFRDAQPPQAPAGDDNETRPLQLQEDKPIIVFDPLPPPPPPPPPQVTTTSKTLPPAISNIKTKLLVSTTKVTSVVRRGKRKVRLVHFKQKLTLRLTFAVHRRVMLGLNATRGARTVASSKLRTYSPPSGKILLKLTRKLWPKRFAFITDAPTGILADPGAILSGTVPLNATARAIAGRSVTSVAFQYSPAGTDTWTDIGTATASPYSVAFDTTKVANGSYDLRVLVTDNTTRAAVSPTLRARTIQNGNQQ